MGNSTRPIAWVFATETEAKPFVEALALTKYGSKPFGLYSSDSNLEKSKHLLVISGMGSINSSMATSWLAGIAQRSCVWINFGIAGTAVKAIGELCLIHTVSGPLLERTFYPTIVVKNKWSRAGLESQEHPSNSYNELVFDMEASGFVCAAQKFDSKEVIQVVKVISDNDQHPYESFNKDDCYVLIKPHVEELIEFAKALSKLGMQERVSCNVDMPFRTSHSQSRILEELIYKLTLAECWDESAQANLHSQTDARKAIAILNTMVNDIAPNFNRCSAASKT